MKAPAFDYLRAATLAEACAALAADSGARVIAGGQSLMPAMNMRLVAPDQLVDIGGLRELDGIQKTATGLHIGALTRHATVLRSPLVARRAPLLARALADVAHAAIRNRGTIGGNLAHGDPASELPACALALGATFHVQGVDGARTIAAEDFYLGLFETALASGEILTGIDVPDAPSGGHWAFGELARRRGDYAMVGLAATTTVADGRAREPRLVFFSVGNTPVASAGAAAALADKPLDDAEALRAAQDALAADLDPPGDGQISAATRLHMARVLLGRVWRDLQPA